MGDLKGHVLPGMVFVLFGIWWTIAQFIKFHRSFMKNGRPYRNSATHNLFFCKNSSIANFEIEGLFKVLLCSTHLATEIYGASIHPGKRYAHLQHIVILSFFITNGIMDFLVYCKFVIPVRLRLNYITFALAISMQGELFSVHNQHRGHLSVVTHSFIIYLSYFGLITTILEMKYSKSLIIGLAKSFATLMLGVWLSTVGIIIYPPGMDPTEYDKYYEASEMIHITPMIFAIEILFFLFVVIGIGGFIGQFYKKYNVEDGKTQYAKLDAQLIDSDDSVKEQALYTME